MENHGIFRKFGSVATAFFLAWLGFRYFLPLILPFLMGWFFAVLAEPVAQMLHDRLHLSRIFAAGAGVTLVLLFLLGAVWLAGAVCYRELAALAAGIPAYAEAAEIQLGAFRDWLMSLAAGMNGSFGAVLRRTVSGVFDEGNMLLDKLASGAISMAGSVAGKIPGGALTLGTAVISAYMISAQYPSLKAKVLGNETFRYRLEPVLERLRRTVGLWLTAQVKLTGVTFGIVLAGFLLLRVEHPVVWASATAVVDAIPLLGTGTVLVPMTLLSLIVGEQVRAVGLLGLYLTAMLTRSALEPKLVGRQLGMNPLVTLMALYAGFRLWGVLGMILSPILAVSAMQLLNRGE